MLVISDAEFCQVFLNGSRLIYLKCDHFLNSISMSEQIIKKIMRPFRSIVSLIVCIHLCAHCAVNIHSTGEPHISSASYLYLTVTDGTP